MHPLLSNSNVDLIPEKRIPRSSMQRILLFQEDVSSLCDKKGKLRYNVIILRDFLEASSDIATSKIGERYW